MGRRGPKPQPTSLKQAKGTDRPHERAKNPPAVDGDPLPCPPGLRPTARAKWKKLAPQLVERGLLDSTHATLLELFCESWARWVAVRRILQREGETYQSNRGLSARPEVKIEHDLAAMIKALAAEFGMSPAAATRVEAQQPEKPKDEKSQFFSKPKLADTG